MKKFLKFLLVLIVVLIAGILIAGLVMPKDITVSRSVLINAPKEAAFEQIVKFKNWPNWSPFYELDTACQYTYVGTDGTAGSSYSWDSKKKDVGAGSMANKAIDGTKMDYHLDFTRPFKNTADGYLSAADTTGMTKVTWSFSTHCSFPLNGLQILPFMNMEKMLGPSFEHGLDKMKKYLEGHPMAASNPDVKEVDYPAHVFQGIRKTVSWNDLNKFFMESLADLNKNLAEKVNGPAAGIYYTWDTVNKNTDVVAAFPVSDTTKKVKGSSIVHQEASKAFMAVLKGPYSGMMNAHMAIRKELMAKGKTHTMVLEEYIADPSTQKDSTKWVTNIYYLVK